MNRLQLACYCLIASAVVLTGLLLSSTGRILPRAEAELVINKGNLTVLTARSASDEEAMFVLDNVTQRLLVYTLDLRGRTNALELRVNRSLADGFAPRRRSPQRR